MRRTAPQIGPLLLTHLVAGRRRRFGAIFCRVTSASCLLTDSLLFWRSLAFPRLPCDFEGFAQEIDRLDKGRKAKLKRPSMPTAPFAAAPVLVSARRSARCER